MRCPEASTHHVRAVSRRTFLRLVAGTALSTLSCTAGPFSGSKSRPVRFGIVTDCHYADAEPVGTRFYRESLGKLAECVARMNAERVKTVHLAEGDAISRKRNRVAVNLHSDAGRLRQFPQPGC